MLAHVDDARLLKEAFNARARELGFEGDLIDTAWAGFVLGRVSIQIGPKVLGGMTERVARQVASGVLTDGARFAGDLDRSDWQDVLDGAAKLIYAQEWVRAEEKDGRSYPGESIYDVAPMDTPEEAVVEAAIILGRIEAANSISIDQAWLRARNAQIGSREAIAAFEKGEHKLCNDPKFTRARFGECLAYEAMGDGVGWEDDFADHGLKVPDYEVVIECIDEAELTGHRL